MAAGWWRSDEPAPQTRGFPRGMAAGWWRSGGVGGGTGTGSGAGTAGGHNYRWSMLDIRRIRTDPDAVRAGLRSEEHTSELQSLMRISYAVFCLKKKK